MEKSTIEWIIEMLNECVHEDSVLDLSSLFYELEVFVTVNSQNLIEAKFVSAFKVASTSIRAELRRLECRVFGI